MPRILRFLIGLALTTLGIFLLGRNILVTTNYIPTFQGDVLAVFSILGLMLGTITLVLFRRQTGILGWIFIAIGLVSVFLSGRILLRPTSLWYFFFSFTALAVGLNFIRGGRLRF